jgi:signal transduction histidine kinase
VLYDLLRNAWLAPQRPESPENVSLRSRVHSFFAASRGAFDRELYSGILQEGLRRLVTDSFFARFGNTFEFCAVEYRSLAPRISGEAPFPESFVFLFGKSSLGEEEILAIERVMRAAYGRELTYLTLIPENLGWFQVVYHRAHSVPRLIPIHQTVDIGIEEELRWLTDTFGKKWYESYLDRTLQHQIKDEIGRRLNERIMNGPPVDGLETFHDKERLANMVASTPFMTLTRMAQTGSDTRSILYLPAHLHGERLGGAVLIAPRRIESRETLEAVHISLQMLLSHLRLIEFPEEGRLAERDVLLRQFVRRFRHNMMHPLGNLMDSARRFKDSFQQLLVTFERGIDAWKPDLTPNPLVTFLNYVADEFRAEDNLTRPEGQPTPESDDESFPIVVEGTDRIEHFDRSILAEVFRNLMTNTQRYALGKGLQRVEIDAGSKGVLILYREKGGPGLPPEIAADPWRLHPRDLSDPDSSGQGLFLAQKLMEIHGGDIRYERDPSGGCAFRLELRTKGPKDYEYEPENDDRRR